MQPTPTPSRPPEIEQVLPQSGDLGRWPLLYLYYLAASRTQTGRLALRLSDRTIALDFRKGAPTAVESSHADDALLPFLVRAGAVDPQRLAQARADNPAFDQGDAAGALIASRLLDPQQLYGQLIHRAHALLLGCLVSEGTFTFAPLPAELPQGFPLGDRWGLPSALVRLLPAIGLRHRLAQVWARPIMKTGGSVEVSELKLTPQETRALSRFDGVRALSQLTADHPTEADALMRVAFLLRHLEAIAFLQPAPEAQPVGAQTGVPPPATVSPHADASAQPTPQVPTGAEAPPRAVSPQAPVAGAPVAPGPGVPAAGSPGPAAPGAARGTSTAAATRSTRPVSRSAVPEKAVAPTESLASLRALRERLYAEDHFKRLGITEDAPVGAAKIAYFKLARLHHPDTVAHDAPAEVKALKVDIFAAVGEAYRVLSDEASRAAYLEEKASGGAFDVQAILQAEELFTRAALLVKNRRFLDALKHLEEAISLNPEEGEFYAWRAWCHFCTQPDRSRVPAEVVADLDEAVRRSPRCVAAHHYRGSIARLVGNTSEAKLHFEKVLALQPDHVEASRELRILGGKR